MASPTSSAQSADTPAGGIEHRSNDSLAARSDLTAVEQSDSYITDVALGAAIRTRRQALGVRQHALASIVEIDERVFSRIERGERPVRATELPEIATALGTTADQLMRVARAITRYRVTEPEDARRSAPPENAPPRPRTWDELHADGASQEDLLADRLGMKSALRHYQSEQANKAKIDEAQAQAEQIVEDAAAKAERLDAEAAAERDRIQADFDRALEVIRSRDPRIPKLQTFGQIAEEAARTIEYARTRRQTDRDRLEELTAEQATPATIATTRAMADSWDGIEQISESFRDFVQGIDPLSPVAERDLLRFLLDRLAEEVKGSDRVRRQLVSATIRNFEEAVRAAF
ncbi:transcriptional regulator, y4mF family (plasmid) [Tsukamurella tyrosinosolvens]|uniref:Helix-turn-helix domain-containing protein n=1 Tax=Tsukamurella tyrosinosolvens TaxID=57704 RepID=A0A1H4UJ92_TSUTY|nr:helix-turn-helix transcriptional regulator [Tsukamurella tyrosinosolvens]KXO92909.1 hypothetical protein AXK58_13625 [Tsukamurella tyrosinosolvens]SEC68478.1 Helix-turn-helix domain-containing protein [Tsukamurella tyrosinosolvens]VEH94249.1 transcriptional regulator, y4mF family [Tsukamurella tyrosinosolvens]